MVLIVHTRHLTYFGRFLPFSRIRTLIDGVEGGHADHLTNPTAHDESPFVSYLLKLNRKIGLYSYASVQFWCQSSLVIVGKKE